MISGVNFIKLESVRFSNLTGTTTPFSALISYDRW